MNLKNLSLALLFTAGCSGGDSGDETPDATGIAADSATGNDDASIVDAQVPATDATPVDAARLVDASMATDAMPVDLDGGVPVIQECIDACTTILGCSGLDSGGVMGCAQECTTDSLDCSPMQIDELAVCSAAAPGPDCSLLIPCIEAIGCLEGA